MSSLSWSKLGFQATGRWCATGRSGLVGVIQGYKQAYHLVLNKVDKIEEVVAATHYGCMAFTIRVCCDRTSECFETRWCRPVLVSLVTDLLPEGPHLYPADSLTDLPERFIAAEIVREQIFASGTGNSLIRQRLLSRRGRIDPAGGDRYPGAHRC